MLFFLLLHCKHTISGRWVDICSYGELSIKLVELKGVAKNLSFFWICQLLDNHWTKSNMQCIIFSVFSYTFYRSAILFCNIYSFWDNRNYMKLVRGTLWRAKNIQYFAYIAGKCSICFNLILFCIKIKQLCYKSLCWSDWAKNF